MEGGGTEGGTIRPVAESSSHLRIAALAVAVLSAVAVAVTLTMAGFPLSAVLSWSASVALAYAVSLLHLRSALASATVALIPLAGVLAVGMPFALIGAPLGIPLLAYVFGTALATLLADSFVEAILSDRPRDQARRDARRDLARPAVAAGGTAAALLVVFLFGLGVPARMLAMSAVIEIVVTSLVVFFAVPWLLSMLSFDEAFITRNNRLRERRIARAYRASMVVVPRWGMSVSGIALVFVVLAGFGASPAAIALVAPGQYAALAVLAVVSSFFVAGAWRPTAGLVLALVLNWLLALWAAVENVTDGNQVLVMGGGIAVTLLLSFVVAAHARALRSGGDEPSIARLRSIEERSGAVTFAAIAALASTLPWLDGRAMTALPFLLAAGGASGVALAPALTTAVETLLPRHRSVEELYTRR